MKVASQTPINALVGPQNTPRLVELAKTAPAATAAPTLDAKSQELADQRFLQQIPTTKPLYVGDVNVRPLLEALPGAQDPVAQQSLATFFENAPVVTFRFGGLDAAALAALEPIEFRDAVVDTIRDLENRWNVVCRTLMSGQAAEGHA